MSPLAGFAALLRAAGLAISAERLLLAHRALAEVGLLDRRLLHTALRCSLCSAAEQLPLFDAAFALYWRAPGASLAELLPGLPPLAQLRPRRPPQAGPPRSLLEAITPPHAWRPAELPPVVARLGASGREAGAGQGLEGASAAERAAASARARRLAAQLRLPSRSRRWQASGQGRIALAEALRRLQAGRPLLPLPRQRRREPPQILLWLGDVSGSMQEATRALLLWAHAQAQRSGGPAWRFWAFGTRLQALTPLLRAERDADAALRRLGELGVAAQGGTRIGAALQQLLLELAPRLQGGRHTLLIVSDGLDHDPADPLLPQMLAAWRARGVRLLWLDPLAERDSLQASAALAAGVDMRLALQLD